MQPQRPQTSVPSDTHLEWSSRNPLEVKTLLHLLWLGKIDGS